jgi:hypothetical protein
MENTFDESCWAFTAIQWQRVIHSLLKVTEQIQINGLKSVSFVRRKSYDFHLVID